jgi:hypothetical protein
MSVGETKAEAKPSARAHDQYGQFTIISIVIPLLGFILGVVYLTRKNPLDRKLGEHAIAISILCGLMWSVLFSLFSPMRIRLTGYTPSSITTPPSISAPAVVANPQASIGSPLTIDGDTAVTVQQVIDPITASQYAQAPTGTRYVGVKLEITNNSSSPDNSNANNNVTVTRSDNQTATIAFTAATECTNFSSGMYKIAPGSSATGCVFFEIPNGMTATKVQFNAHAGFSGQTGEWTVR